MGTTFRQAEEQALASMTQSEREEFNAELARAEARLRIAELVYNSRVKAGLTQAELAAKAGVAQPNISAIENGARIPSMATLNRIAHSLGMTLIVDMTLAA